MSIDAEQVLAAAKQRMLTQGEHAPLVFVSTDARPHCLPIKGGWNEDHTSRMKALFLLGRAFAQEAHVTAEMVSALFLVAEVWVSNKPELESPVEEQPDRRECLSVLELRKEGKTLHQTMYLVDILRQGGVIDLGPRQKVTEIQGSLLTSFFAGVGSAQWSDRQFAERLRHSQDVGDL
jgi:hypothetical protein